MARRWETVYLHFRGTERVCNDKFSKANTLRKVRLGNCPKLIHAEENVAFLVTAKSMDGSFSS